MKLNKSLLSLIFLLATGMIAGILVFPRYQEITDLEAQIEEKQTALNQRQQYFSDLNQLSKKLDQYPKALAKVESGVPDRPDSTLLLNFIQKIASEKGVSLAGIGSLESTFSKEKLGELGLSLTLSGSYADFKEFLKSLEKSSRIIEVENLSLSTSKGEEGISFESQLEIKTFFGAQQGSPGTEIDFSFLESPALKELELFKKVKPFEGEVGRENPFMPY